MTAERAVGAERTGPATWRPEIGPAVPGWSLRAMTALAGTGLAFLTLSRGWFWLALILLAAGVAVPRLPGTWAALVVLAGSATWHAPSVVDIRIYALIAGVHLLHLTASYSLVVPLRGRIALRALVPALRRYLLIQVAVQASAAVALAVFTRIGTGFDLPTVVAAVALLAIVFTLIAALSTANPKAHRPTR